VTMAGTGIDPVPPLTRDAMSEATGPRARLVGQQGALSPSLAALVNGTAGHVLDYDDVHNAVPGHVTINIAPSVLALGEDLGASGADVLTAFIAGFELMCKLGEGFDSSLFLRGWQGTTIGAVASAAACAKLLQLDVEKTAMAMALAVAQASGIHGNYGSMAKCLNVGLAAQAGVRAATWAARGITGRADVIERSKGFIDTYGGRFETARALATPQGGWHLYRNLFKVHASCFLTHGALMAWANLVRDQALSLADIAQIRVRIEGERHRIVLTDPPKDGLEAKFNLPFCLAMAIHGIDTSDPANFDTATTARADLQATARRVVVDIDPDLWFEAAEVSVTLNDASERRAYADAGKPLDDMAALSKLVEAKALGLFGLPDDAGRALVERFRAFATLPRIADLHPEETYFARRSDRQ
jgi:2-methylcitrate dehydratase PrpD